MDIAATSPDFVNSRRTGSQRPCGTGQRGLLHSVVSWLGVEAASPSAPEQAAPAPVQGAGLSAHEFFKIGEEMQRLCRREGRPLSLLVVELDELRELKRVYGPRATKEVIAKTAAKLKCLATNSGVAGWTSLTIFTVLVPGISCEKVSAAADAVLGNPGCLRFSYGSDEIVLAPQLRVQALSREVTMQAVHQAMCQEISDARLDIQRLRQRLDQERKWQLEWERETHSAAARLQATIPMGLESPVQLGMSATACSAMAATVPMPLAK